VAIVTTCSKWKFAGLDLDEVFRRGGVKVGWEETMRSSGPETYCVTWMTFMVSAVQCGRMRWKRRGGSATCSEGLVCGGDIDFLVWR
jgi:hypothetical protein